MLIRDGAHAFCDMVECLVPGDGFELLAPILLHTKHRLAQSVRVLVAAQPARSPSAQPALTMEVLGMAYHLPGSSILLVNRSGATPETDVANGGRCPYLTGPGQRRVCASGQETRGGGAGAEHCG